MLQQPVRGQYLQPASECPDQTAVAVPASHSAEHTAGGCCWTGCAPIAVASPGWHVARPPKCGIHGPMQLVRHHARKARDTAPGGRRGTPHK
eukprot:2840406-Pleurochrysis_carterae.AAC.1